MKKDLLMGVLIGLSGLLAAQNQPPPGPEDAYQKAATVLRQDLENHKNELANQAEAQRLEFKALVSEEVDSIRDYNDWLLWGIVGTFGISLIGWFGVWRRTNKFVATEMEDKVQSEVLTRLPQRVEDTLKDLIQKESTPLLELIQDKTLEGKIREEAFALICFDEADQKEAMELMRILGFRAAQPQLLADYSGNPQTELVVYYDMNQKMIKEKDQVLIDHLADARQRAKGTIFVFAYPGYWKDLNLYKDMANAANSPYTLYARLVESLSFLHLKKKRT